MTGQPDLLDDKGVQKIIELLDTNTDVETKRIALKWTKECCIMQEKNRQNLFNANIVDKLKPLVQGDSPPLIREVVGVCRVLLLDDDVRVEFGKAHEHARVIAGEFLTSLLELLERKTCLSIFRMFITCSCLCRLENERSRYTRFNVDAVCTSCPGGVLSDGAEGGRSAGYWASDEEFQYQRSKF